MSMSPNFFAPALADLQMREVANDFARVRKVRKVARPRSDNRPMSALSSLLIAIRRRPASA
ncbi:MAG TPA: hypothetical protein VF314_09970 [Actinomycetes bacterium]